MAFKEKFRKFGGSPVELICCLTKGGRQCKSNMEVVTTLGGTKWFYGPRIRACYYYDHQLTRIWLKATDLKEGRAFASAAVLPNGKLWIVGGLGSNEVLSSTEVVYRDATTQEWSAKCYLLILY